MMFRADIQIFGIDVVPKQSDPDVQPDMCEISLTSGSVVPISPQQALPIPIGIIRTAVDKKTALALADQIREVAEGLHERSDIVTASSLAGVDKLADQVGQFRGGPSNGQS